MNRPQSGKLSGFLKTVTTKTADLDCRQRIYLLQSLPQTFQLLTIQIAKTVCIDVLARINRTDQTVEMFGAEITADKFAGGKTALMC
jgi:hypothetical protein